MSKRQKSARAPARSAAKGKDRPRVKRQRQSRIAVEALEKDKPLSPREATFCEEYIVDLNGAQAAIRAGYAVKSAKVSAARLLTRDNVTAKIEALMLARSVRTGIRADHVLQELAKLTFSDIGVITRGDGTFREPKDWPAEFRAAVASMNYAKSKDGRVRVKVKLWDKGRAINLAMQHLGIVRKKLELTGKNGLPLEARRVNIYMPDNGRRRRAGV